MSIFHSLSRRVRFAFEEDFLPCSILLSHLHGLYRAIRQFRLWKIPAPLSIQTPNGRSRVYFQDFFPILPTIRGSAYFVLFELLLNLIHKPARQEFHF